MQLHETGDRLGVRWLRGIVEGDAPKTQENSDQNDGQDQAVEVDSSAIGLARCCAAGLTFEVVELLLDISAPLGVFGLSRAGSFDGLAGDSQVAPIAKGDRDRNNPQPDPEGHIGKEDNASLRSHPGEEEVGCRNHGQALEHAEGGDAIQGQALFGDPEGGADVVERCEQQQDVCLFNNLLPAAGAAGVGEIPCPENEGEGGEEEVGAEQ